MMLLFLVIMILQNVRSITIMRYELDNCKGPYTNVSIVSEKCYYDGEIEGSVNPLSYSIVNHVCTTDLTSKKETAYLLQVSTIVQSKCNSTMGDKKNKEGNPFTWPYKLAIPDDEILTRGSDFAVHKYYKHSECITTSTRK